MKNKKSDVPSQGLIVFVSISTWIARYELREGDQNFQQYTEYPELGVYRNMNPNF